MGEELFLFVLKGLVLVLGNFSLCRVNYGIWGEKVEKCRVKLKTVEKKTIIVEKNLKFVE